MQDNKVLDVIIALISGIKNGDRLSSLADNQVVELDQCGYLLSQILRHYQILPSNCFVSEKAFDLWNQITTESIFNYTYRDRVKKNKEGTVFVDKYKGSEKVSHNKNCKIVCGDTFIFNDVFIDEHIVPISVIIKNLLDLPRLDYTSVKSVLDKMCICKLLKEEDRHIANRSNRSIDYREVINTDYIKADIIVKDFVYDTDIRAYNKLLDETEEKTIKNNLGEKK